MTSPEKTPNGRQPPAASLFKVPTPDEVARRQRDLRDKVSLNKFAPGSTTRTPTTTSRLSVTDTPPAGGSSNKSNTNRNIADPSSVALNRLHTPAGPSGTAHLNSVAMGRQHSAGAGGGVVVTSRATTPLASTRGSLPLPQPQGQTAQSANPLLANDPPRRAGASRTGNSIIVNSCQRGNGILKYIRNVPWEYGPIVPDYQIGETACALFLSLKYHRLHPDYVYTRIKQLGQSFLIRVLLCVVDIDDHQSSIRDLTRIAVYNSFTIILAWSAEEAGRYLETFKAYEHKPPDILKERVDPDYLAKLTDAITQIKSINKTDVITLASAFGSLKNIIAASPDDLEQCPGFGKEKVRRLHEAFNEPFLLNKKRRS
ncbi:ssDNA endonuclease and repair protein rad10 [Geranomyces variabilis]|nr:ssDNA endonuclease and repair protein rad10 [Geranomyces variabilis]